MTKGTLSVKKILLRGTASLLSHFSMSSDDTTPGRLQIKRSLAGGGESSVLELMPSGDLVLPEATGAPNPRGAVMQMMLANMLPKVIPALEGQRSFKKTGGKTISIKAGTTVIVGGMFRTYTVDTAVVMPDVLVPGEDYGIWALPSGVLFANADGKPAPYYPIPSQAGAVKLGGFHYGLLAHDAQLAGGGFAQAAPSMVWTQADVDKIAGINAHSIWDEAFRPECDARGMTCVTTSAGEGLFWFDIYFTGTEHIVNGTSRAGADVASGTVPPKIPTMFGGNGTSKYTTFNWYEAIAEVAQSHGKRGLSYQEFCAAAFGVTESQSLGGASSTIPLTKREAGYTSKWGGEQMTGNHYTFGDVTHGVGGTAFVSGAVRGQTYGTPYATLLGGTRNGGISSGSRCTHWSAVAWNTDWTAGLRAACNHKRPQ